MPSTYVDVKPGDQKIIWKAGWRDVNFLMRSNYHDRTENYCIRRKYVIY